MQLREAFVLQALEAGVCFTRLCREHGVSRKTGYKWLARYRSGGVAALEAMSRRPRRAPLATSADVVAQIVALRVAHRTWGARKLHAVLARTLTDDALPSERTVARVLERSGLVEAPARRRVRRMVPPAKAPRVEVGMPNDLWTVDFKGWWRTRDRRRCEPLTVRDAHSRYVLAVVAMSSTAESGVRRVFERLFARWGLPRAILSDNGTPFVSTRNPAGLTSLSAWWRSLGIRHVRSRIASPQDNGAHERMHADIQRELEALPAATSRAQQAAFDRWRHDFNHHRPHEALGMTTPSEKYRASPRPLRGKSVAPPAYPAGWAVRRVDTTGRLQLGGKKVFVSEALRGHDVGLERVDPRGWKLWFYADCFGVMTRASDGSLAFSWAGERRRA